MKQSELSEVLLEVIPGDQLKLDTSSREKLFQSLASQATILSLKYLLSFHEDGVVWGHFDPEGKTWLFSEKLFEVSPSFRLETLLECRFFGESAELHLWRSEAGINSTLLKEGKGEPYACFDRQMLLWGDHAEAAQDGFSLLTEGRQGLRHTPPLDTARPRLALQVREYIDYENNQAYVRWSRLTGLIDGIK